MPTLHRRATAGCLYIPSCAFIQNPRHGRATHNGAAQSRVDARVAVFTLFEASSGPGAPPGSDLLPDRPRGVRTYAESCRGAAPGSSGRDPARRRHRHWVGAPRYRVRPPHAAGHKDGAADALICRRSRSPSSTPCHASTTGPLQRAMRRQSRTGWYAKSSGRPRCRPSGCTAARSEA